MRIQTFSIITGSTACNAQCPFCVSKMTAPNGVQSGQPIINWRNFDKACRLAQLSGVTTVMLTGKGEPTIFPSQISSYLEALKKYNFPLVELQTNGLLIRERDSSGNLILENALKMWHQLGLSMVAISVVHHYPEHNRKIYTPHRKEYIDLPATIKYLHELGFSVRLSCVMAKGYVESPEAVENMINFARQQGVEQLTFTPVNLPASAIDPDNHDAYDKHWVWASDNMLSSKQIKRIREELDDMGVRLMELSHGAIVYDVRGQNVCLSNCLVVKPDASELRNLIFFPDGHLRYHWQFSGAILL